MQELPSGQKINEDTTRYEVNEGLFIDSHRRTWLEFESWHFGIFSPTGVTIEIGNGEVGRVVNYLGGADTLAEALQIAHKAKAKQSQVQLALF